MSAICDFCDRVAEGDWSMHKNGMAICVDCFVKLTGGMDPVPTWRLEAAVAAERLRRFYDYKARIVGSIEGGEDLLVEE